MSSIEDTTLVSIKNLRRNITNIAAALKNKKVYKNEVLLRGGIPLIYANMVMNVLFHHMESREDGFLKFDEIKETVNKLFEDEAVKFRIVEHTNK